MVSRHIVKAPQLNVNDEFLTLVSWKLPPGSSVSEDEAIAEFESTKTSALLEAPVSGFIFPLVAAATRVSPGDAVAVISGSSADTSEEVMQWAAQPKPAPVPSGVASMKARILALKLGIDLATVAPVNGVITEESVKAYLRTRSKEETRAPLKIVGADVAGKILILGGGGHAKIVVDVLRESGRDGIAGIVDRDLEIGSEILGVRVIARDDSDSLKTIFAEGVCEAAIGLGGVFGISKRGQFCSRAREIGFDFPRIIHPRASVSSSARIGEGVLILGGAVVGPDAVIGDFSIVNSNAVVSHDCRIGRNVHVTPGALIAGRVSVGNDTLVGMGVTIYMDVTIGSGVTIANGRSVACDVPDGAFIN